MKIRETHRVVFMGTGGVGKTSLISQFMEGTFESTYKPTVEDYHRHNIKTPDGTIHTVEIVDTSGTHVFPAMRELSIRSGKAFILVFALDDVDSFDEALNLWDVIAKMRGCGNLPMVLVGNKSDLERQVTLEMVLDAKASHMNDCPYIETSAKFNSNVVKLFIELLQQANRLAGAGSSTPDELKKQKLGRRLSSFSSLPNITLMRRKTNSMSKDGDRSRQEAKNKRQMSAEGNTSRPNDSMTLSSASAAAGKNDSGINQFICNNVDCLVDQGSTGIRRVVINGIDTISLTESLPIQQESKCTIL